MRTLSSTLESAQQASSIDPLAKIVLTQGENSYTYTKTRIKSIDPHTEQPYSLRATILLDNSDGVLTDIDFKGYQGVISNGVITKAGEEYDATAPLWVLEQKFYAAPGQMTCQLDLVGIPNLMAEDRASADYRPESTDTETVKDLVDAIAGATLACFNHCTAYDVVWDDEDDLVDTFQPKDGFTISVNESRLAKLKRLLDYTELVPVFKADGKIHIIQPTTSGESYDSEYSIDSGHTFFNKAYRHRLVIPNYVVVRSRDDNDPQYSGFAKDTASNDLLPMRQYKRLRLQSNDQATNIATALLSKYQLWSDLGSADVPMNVGAELYDYVKVSAFTSEDTNRTGNIGYISRHFKAGKSGKPGEFWMRFGFGSNFQEQIRQLNNQITSYGDDITNVSDEVYIENLFAEYIEATYILAGQIDVGYLSALTAKMGILTTGEIRIGTGDLDQTHGTATGGSTTTVVDTGQSWTPDEHIGKKIRIVPDPYVMENPVTGESTTFVYPYYEVEITDNDATSITFAAIAEAVGAGDYYAIGYGNFTGFRIWGLVGEVGRMAGYNAGVEQFYCGSDGKLYAGGGAVKLDADGVHLYGETLAFYDVDENLRCNLYGGLLAFYITAQSGKPISLFGDHFAFNGSDLRPVSDAGTNIGTSTKQFGKGFFKNRLKIPVGTDMYD